MAGRRSGKNPPGQAKELFTDLEAELTAEQRVHFWILMTSREDWATARAAGYIDKNGLVDATALRYKKRLRVYRPGRKREKDWLLGAFNTPMTEAGLVELVEYWRGSAPLISFRKLGIPELSASEFLQYLEKATSRRQTGGNGLPLDTLD